MLRNVLYIYLLVLLTACPKTAKDYPELIIKDITIGKGEAAGKYDTVLVHYVGRFPDGKVFDSSQSRFGGPHKYSLTAKTLIEGWRLGIVGMKVGGKRRLTIPPHLAFGPQGKAGRIPPNSTIIFDIELLKVE